MANALSLCNDIEHFLQQSDANSRSQFVDWLKSRLNFALPSDAPERKDSFINSSQLFACQCGHRYSLHFTVTDDLDNASDSVRSYLCTKCQIRLPTREAFLKHYAMHRQGYVYCTRCSQFYKHDEVKVHDCGQRKIDELQSLEQLIPPDGNEQEQQQDCKSPVHSCLDYANDPETSSSARVTHFGLPKLTDSITEVRHADGKRQFRCPICSNSYVNRSGLNRHYITHSSQDLWKVGTSPVWMLPPEGKLAICSECQYCGKRYSRKDSLKHHMKTQHAQLLMSNWSWKDTDGLFQSCNNLSNNSLEVESSPASSTEKEPVEHDDVLCRQ